MEVMPSLKEGQVPRAVGAVIAKNPVESAVKTLQGGQSQR